MAILRVVRLDIQYIEINLSNGSRIYEDQCARKLKKKPRITLVCYIIYRKLIPLDMFPDMFKLKVNYNRNKEEKSFR